MKKIFSLLLLIVVFSSSCNEKEETMKGFSMNRIFFIEYVNADGTNILNYDSQIQVYYERNGIAEKVEQSNLSFPLGYTITSLRDVSPEGLNELCVKVFPSDYMDEEKSSITNIKLDDYQTDTIKCQFDISSNSVYLQKIMV